MSDNKLKLESAELPRDLTSPIQLAEKLSISVEVDRGNTPRPSKSSMFFISGMASVQKKQFENAFKQLAQSVKEAEADKKNKEALATSLCGLGYLCDCLKQYDRAVVCYLRALKIWEKLHSSDPCRVVPFMVDTATVLQHSGKLDDSFMLFEKARNLLIDVHGEKNSKVLAVTCAIANLKTVQLKYDEAEELYTHALEFLKELNDTNQIAVMKQLIKVKELLKKDDEIASLEEQLQKMKSECEK